MLSICSGSSPLKTRMLSLSISWIISAILKASLFASGQRQGQGAEHPLIKIFRPETLLLTCPFRNQFFINPAITEVNGRKMGAMAILNSEWAFAICLGILSVMEMINSKRA